MAAVETCTAPFAKKLPSSIPIPRATVNEDDRPTGDRPRNGARPWDSGPEPRDRHEPRTEGATMPDDESFHTVIYRMGADGSNPELLGNPDTFDVEPRISPDGSRITFARLTFVGDNMQASIIVRDLESGVERELGAAGNEVEHPNWSPDGEWIIYNDLPSTYLARVRTDGTGEAVVIYDPPGDDAAFKPWYSPDCRRIVFGCS
jgi:Tol biopolymer transport system component